MNKEIWQIFECHIPVGQFNNCMNELSCEGDVYVRDKTNLLYVLLKLGLH